MVKFHRNCVCGFRKESKYILLRIHARPACDQPLYSNGDRVAHRMDNSVAALLELTPETGRGQGFNPAPFRPRTIRAGKGQSPRVDIPIVPARVLRRGKVPRLRSTPDTNRLHGTFRDRDNRADVIADLDGQIDYRGSKNPLRTSYVTQDGVSIKEKKTT